MKNSGMSSGYSRSIKLSLTLLLISLSLVLGRVCDVVNLGTSFDPKAAEWADCQFFVLDNLFHTLLEGASNAVNLVMEDEQSIFHEGPVLFDDALFFTTNRLGNMSDPVWGATAPAQLDQFIEIKRLDLKLMELSTVNSAPVDILMANGMTKTADGQNILALSQGFNSTGGAIYELNRNTYEATAILDTFYGKKFNALNDIKVTSDGIIFFSDPVYGFEQGFRTGNPELGSNVYRYDIASKTTTLVVTDLQRPNGVGLWDGRSQGKGCTLFLTDSGFGQATANETIQNKTNQRPRGFDGEGESSLYIMRDDDGCFEPSSGPWSVQPLLPATNGIQDGIDVHASTELLFFCDGTGLWIWSIPLVRPIGLVPVVCTQVSLPQTMGLSTVYILAETHLYSVVFNFNASIVPVDPSTSSSSKPVLPLLVLLLTGVATTMIGLL